MSDKSVETVLTLKFYFLPPTPPNQCWFVSKIMQTVELHNNELGVGDGSIRELLLHVNEFETE